VKVIVIKDADAVALLDTIEFEALKLIDNAGSQERFNIEKVHRALHYHVCRWLQDQGADVIAKR